MKPLALLMSAYMLLGSCFPLADFSQLTKLPDLLGHYQLHQELALESGGTLSFFEFLQLHFFDKGSHQEEHPGSDHHDLPLQQLQLSGSIIYQEATIICIEQREIITKSRFFYSSSSFRSYSKDVLQPPRV